MFSPQLPHLLRARLRHAWLAASLVCLTAAAYASPITATRTTLSAAQAGQGATFHAAVLSDTGIPVAAGTVDFLLPDGQSLGSAVVGADGTATLSVASLPHPSDTTLAGEGAVPVAALFHPSSASYAASQSPATAVAVPEASSPTADFSVTGNPTTVTVQQGDYGTTALTVSSLGAFSGPIQFSCSDLPAQVTCAFNPTLQTLAANGSFVTTLQLSTQAASGTASSAIPTHSAVALALLLPGALLLLSLGRRRRGAQWLAIALLLGGGTLGLSGCSQRYGYFHHGPTVATGTPAGTYSIHVVIDGDELSTTLEHDLYISLVVK